MTKQTDPTVSVTDRPAITQEMIFAGERAAFLAGKIVSLETVKQIYIAMDALSVQSSLQDTYLEEP